MKNIFGWFASADPTPTHDPGLNIDCPFCSKRLERPLKTISLLGITHLDGDGKAYTTGYSYFYRSHKDCYENASPDRIRDIESDVIDDRILDDELLDE